MARHMTHDKSAEDVLGAEMAPTPVKPVQLSQGKDKHDIDM